MRGQEAAIEIVLLGYGTSNPILRPVAARKRVLCDSAKI